ncbi:MAG: hypothetical protein WKF96_03140 [Solirubrobacteraceae bacterium]
MRSPKGRWTMGGRAHARTIYTGFGVTGSMLAAVGATFLVASTILAFDRWPGDLVDPPVSELAVASVPASSAAPASDTIALPAAVRADAAAPAGPGTPDTGPGNGVPPEGPNGPGGPSNPPPTGPVATTPPPAGPSTPTPGGAAGSPGDDQLASVLEATTGATADTVRSVGSGPLSVAAPATDLVGGLVEGAGQSLGDALRALGGNE